MLSLIFTGLGFVTKLLGLADLAAKLFDKAEARRDGMVQQQNAELRATVKTDAVAAATSAQVAGESDAEVRADLQKDFRP
ncbi:MAG TPA: hypothetical protein VN821_03885 [Candidatus Udaeobacter sp.]|nr:hypothetical protein [Candidatus Udaeobacter sp.]HYW33669.1 hypothetical protein [Candidatus Bathyarchaeia archaeon]